MGGRDKPIRSGTSLREKGAAGLCNRLYTNPIGVVKRVLTPWVGRWDITRLNNVLLGLP